VKLGVILKRTMTLEMNTKKKKNSLIVEKGSSVQSVHRAADILDCISNGINSVSEIAEKCSLHKSTVHRLLKALGESKMVIQNPHTRRYYPGYKFVNLSLMPVTIHEYLIDKASEEMLHLSQLTNETIDLRINIGLKNIGLCLVQSKYDQITIGDSLRIRPIHLGVDGRVLLSQLDDITLSSVLEHVRMEKAKKYENINTNDLMDEIRIIRQQGYAVVHDELIKGVTCICAPVHNYVTPAALSIVGPEMRIKPNIKSHIEKLLFSSNLISKDISEYNKEIQ